MKLDQLAKTGRSRRRRSPAASSGATRSSAGSPTGGWPIDGKTYRWQVRGVSFDEAFRVAMGGAAQILSGNGQP